MDEVIIPIMMKKSNNFRMVLTWGLFIFLLRACSEPEEVNKAVTSKDGVYITFNKMKRIEGGQPFLEGDFPQVKLIGTEDGMTAFPDSLFTYAAVNISSLEPDIWAITLSFPGMKNRDGNQVAGFFFDKVPGFKQGVEIWRYKPWNSWTKPLRINSPGEVHEWDVQFLYWQYEDGLYGAAIPLSGNGYRTTLGSENGMFGCKALTYSDNASSDSIPMMAVGFGENPYQLFEKLYRSGLQLMGRDENLRVKKSYPDAMEYIGWCTWNSSHMGQYLDEKHLLEGVSTFTDCHFPLGWLLVDDGWFDQDGSRLNAFTPNPAKFPNGFKSLNAALKSKHGLKHVGIWHAYDGYWNGINPNSGLGEQYRDEIFSWDQHELVQDVNSETITYYFIRPDSDSLLAFYESWHRYFADEGFTFVKVDNQLVSERMCVDNYPIFYLAERMHAALYASVFKYFEGGIINCMDMTNDAFYNFGKTAVARCVEDYFPEADGGIGYELERGGAAAHVLMALYNSLYFSQMVYTDFDMFESHNTFAEYHAVARAVSGGPIYVTDTPGKQNFGVLWPLINSDGTILRADQPALLTEDCLFQLQDKKVLKAFSFAGKSGLLAAFNAADADQVKGSFSPSELYGLEGERFAVYEYFSKELMVLEQDEQISLELKRMECKYFNLVPIQHEVALIGLIDKYNAPATILDSSITKHKITAKLKGTGTFKALLPSRPDSILLNQNALSAFTFENGTLTFVIESGEISQIEILF
ncbi:MAG: Sip1-related alpha-galactosidase [Bacteroidota bacterium]